MEALVITWRELLIVVVLVLAVYVAEVLLLTRSSGTRGRKQDAQPLQADTTELQAQLAALRERLENLQEEVEALKQSQANSPYSQSIQLAQQGVDAAQIASTCGISRGEAELIVALYRSPRTS